MRTEETIQREKNFDHPFPGGLLGRKSRYVLFNSANIGKLKGLSIICNFFQSWEGD